MIKINGLCVLDVDGTLIEEEVIDLLGQQAGCENQIAEITSRAMRGELDFERSLRERVKYLEGLPQSVFEDVYQQIHLSKNAQEFVKILHENGISVGLVSGGFYPVVNRLARELGITHVSANHLEIRDGFLTGKLVGEIITREVKKERLISWAQELQVPVTNTIAIGDGANDLCMLKQAGIGIAFCAKDIVKQQISKHVDERDLMKVLDKIGFL